MSTRKIRLSQKLTLSFRGISMPEATSNLAELMSQETDQENSDETFNSLPDLLPYIFQSQEKSSTPDLPYLVTDCSTYKLWESRTTNAIIPLASQIEEVEHWLLSGTHTSGVDNLQSNDIDIITIPTRIGVRENLRRVQAFSPYTSIQYVEKDVSQSEDLLNAHAGVTCDLAIEFERHQDSLDIDGDTDGICADSYLILDDNMTKESPFDESAVAGETAEESRFSSISEVTDGQEEHIDKHSEVNKSGSQASNYDSLDFPKEFRKQKRSNPRRREGPSASIDLVHKVNWLSDIGNGQDHLERDQGAQATVNLPDKKGKRTSQTRKTQRKTVSISSGRKLLSETPANQSVKLKPSGRRGRKKANNSGTLAVLNQEMKSQTWEPCINPEKPAASLNGVK